MGELLSFDLPTVFRCAVELSEAASYFKEEQWADRSSRCEGPASPHFERELEASDRLQRIGEETQRLKWSLGATGTLEFHGGEMDGGPEWDCFEQRFKNTCHDRVVRLALLKLATAAIDLSGFVTWRELHWDMWDKGLRLLTLGLAQLWEGMSADERSSVRDRLPRTSKAIGWPSNPANDPDAYEGPEEIPLPDQYRIIENYVTCPKEQLNHMQEANNRLVEQSQDKFLRLATLAEFIEAANRALLAIQDRLKWQNETPEEWGEWYQIVFPLLASMRRAEKVQPREVWATAVMEQRIVLARAAAILLRFIGGTTESKAGMQHSEVKKALDQFVQATQQLKEQAVTDDQGKENDMVPAVGQLQTMPGTVLPHTHSQQLLKSSKLSNGKRKKRQTPKGGADDKIIAALNLHHQYDNGSCLKLETISNNDLAKLADVSTSTTFNFFKKYFGNHEEYRRVCCNTSKLVQVFKIFNREFSSDTLLSEAQEDIAQSDLVQVSHFSVM